MDNKQYYELREEFNVLMEIERKLNFFHNFKHERPDLINLNISELIDYFETKRTLFTNKIKENYETRFGQD